MDEIWKPIPGYDGLYEASSYGNIRSLDREEPYCRNNKIYYRYRKGKRLRQKKEKDGYLRVTIYKNGTGKLCGVHRLVAKTFLPNPYNLPEVNHIDADRKNNKLNNLEWIESEKNKTSTYHKPGILNEKYITPHCNGYRLQLKQHKENGIRKTYKTLEEAIKAREALLSLGEYSAERKKVFRFRSDVHAG